MSESNYVFLFKALADESRLKIIKIIDKEKEICACELIKFFDFTQPTFSYHMKMLKDASLVDCTKNGVMCVYRLNYDTIKLLGNILDR